MHIKYDVNNSIGNESSFMTDDEIDYYTSYSFPYFAIVEAYSSYFILNISIVQDCILESHEFFYVIASPPELPDGHIQCRAGVFIVDNRGT